MLDWLANPEIWIAGSEPLTALSLRLCWDRQHHLPVGPGRCRTTPGSLRAQRNLPVARRAGAHLPGLVHDSQAGDGLLFSISFVMGLTKPWVTVFGHGISGRDLILVGGGLF